MFDTLWLGCVLTLLLACAGLLGTIQFFANVIRVCPSPSILSLAFHAVFEAEPVWIFNGKHGVALPVFVSSRAPLHRRLRHRQRSAAQQQQPADPAPSLAHKRTRARKAPRSRPCPARACAGPPPGMCVSAGDWNRTTAAQTAPLLTFVCCACACAYVRAASSSSTVRRSTSLARANLVTRTTAEGLFCLSQVRIIPKRTCSTCVFAPHQTLCSPSTRCKLTRCCFVRPAQRIIYRGRI